MVVIVNYIGDVVKQLTANAQLAANAADAALPDAAAPAPAADPLPVLPPATAGAAAPATTPVTLPVPSLTAIVPPLAATAANPQANARTSPEYHPHTSLVPGGCESVPRAGCILEAPIIHFPEAAAAPERKSKRKSRPVPVEVIEPPRARSRPDSFTFQAVPDPHYSRVLPQHPEYASARRGPSLRGRSSMLPPPDGASPSSTGMWALAHTHIASKRTRDGTPSAVPTTLATPNGNAAGAAGVSSRGLHQKSSSGGSSSAGSSRTSIFSVCGGGSGGEDSVEEAKLANVQYSDALLADALWRLCSFIRVTQSLGNVELGSKGMLPSPDGLIQTIEARELIHDLLMPGECRLSAAMEQAKALVECHCADSAGRVYRRFALSFGVPPETQPAQEKALRMLQAALFAYESSSRKTPTQSRGQHNLNATKAVEMLMLELEHLREEGHIQAQIEPKSIRDCPVETLEPINVPLPATSALCEQVTLAPQQRDVAGLPPPPPLPAVPAAPPQDLAQV